MIPIHAVIRCTITTSVTVVIIAAAFTSFFRSSTDRGIIGVGDKITSGTAFSLPSWALSKSVIRSQIDHGRFSLLEAWPDDLSLKNKASNTKVSLIILSRSTSPPSIVGELLHRVDAAKMFPLYFKVDDVGVSEGIQVGRAMPTQKPLVGALSRDIKSDHAQARRRARARRGFIGSFFDIWENGESVRKKPESKLPQRSSIQFNQLTVGPPSQTKSVTEGKGKNTQYWQPRQNKKSCPAPCGWGPSKSVLCNVTPSSTLNPATASVAYCSSSNPDIVFVLYAITGITIDPILRQQQNIPTYWPSCLQSVSGLLSIPDPSLRSAVALLARHHLAAIVLKYES